MVHNVNGQSDNWTAMYRMVMAAWGSQAIRALAGLSVAEHLEEGPLGVEQLATRESVDPAMLYRLLRVGVAMDVLNYDTESQTFCTTPMLRVLHEDASESLKHYAQALPGPAFWHAAERTPRAVAVGRNQSVDVLGSTLFDYFGEHPEAARQFTAAMSDLSTPVIREAVSVIDVQGAASALDVGGAGGAFLCELVERNPQLTGAVLDLEHVIPGVAEEAQRRGLTHKVHGIAGNFFEPLPAADIYLLKFILHDWDDRACTTLLANVCHAMNPGARLFIVEMVVQDNAASLDAALMDMVMLCSLTGQERDLPHFNSLITEAGLRTVDVRALRGSYRVIEAVAASPG
jgi:hypothetical protein